MIKKSRLKWFQVKFIISVAHCRLDGLDTLNEKMIMTGSNVV